MLGRVTPAAVRYVGRHLHAYSNLPEVTSILWIGLDWIGLDPWTLSLTPHSRDHLSHVPGLCAPCNALRCTLFSHWINVAYHLIHRNLIPQTIVIIRL